VVGVTGDEAVSLVFLGLVFESADAEELAAAVVCVEVDVGWVHEGTVLETNWICRSVVALLVVAGY
ncbi:hypothetical protein L195_g029716, partial [Trifolium pratense]